MRRYQLGAHTKTDLKVHHPKKQFWGKHFWARGYLAVSSGNITDEMIQQYIQKQEGASIQMAVDLKSTLRKTPRLVVKGCLVKPYILLPGILPIRTCRLYFT